MKTNPAAYCRGFSCESELSADKINELKQKVEDAYDSITLTTSYEEAGNDADLIIAIFDSSKELDEEDYEILKLIKNKKSIILLNKNDLKNVIDENNEKIKNASENILKISALNKTGL